MCSSYARCLDAGYILPDLVDVDVDVKSAPMSTREAGWVVMVMVMVMVVVMVMMVVMRLTPLPTREAGWVVIVIVMGDGDG